MLHLRRAPASHAVPAAFDRNQLAGHAHLADCVAKRGGLLETHLIVLGAVYHQERRHSLVNGGDGRNRVQLREAGFVQLVDAKEMNAAAVRRVTVDRRHIKALRMLAPLERLFSVVGWTIEIHHGRYFGRGRLVGTGVVHEEAAGRFADDRNPGDIHAVFGRMRLHPTDRAVYVFHRFGEMDRRRQPVIDAEPGEAGIGQRLEQRTDICALAPLIEASAVDQDSGGKRSRSVRHVQVEQ